MMMVMYEDDSVEVRYRHGAQLQSSPCGSEFSSVKAADAHGHPSQPPERVRQRTRFTISAYKESMVATSAFRNKYARQPYIPEELSTVDNRKPFFSVDATVKWPEWSSYKPEFGPGGEITVRSEEGRATLVSSSSGEEFSVEFTCHLSRPHHQTVCSLTKDPDGSPKSRQEVNAANEQMHLTSAAEKQPEQKYQSTTVTQHHSCFAVDPTWVYPLSLARHHWTAHLANGKDAKTEETCSSGQADEGVDISDKNREDRESQLPQALPLTCPSPHQHRWKIKDFSVAEEVSDLPTELVKILWCQGVTYRISDGEVPVVEVSPGDGSVIRSNGALCSYFTHHKPKLQPEEGREITYHLSSLPPDVPGQSYPLGSISSRANRILVCYKQVKHLSKFPVMPTCLQQNKHVEPKSHEQNPEQNPSSAVFDEKLPKTPQTAESRSDVVAAESEKIKRMKFSSENNHSSKREPRNSEGASLKLTQDEPVNEDYVAEALQRTSEAIKEIDTLVSNTVSY